jgi:chorismate--pyruvate lyase
LLRHDKVRIIGEDARLLGLPQAAPGRVREVYLYCGDRPVVFAHSILPTQALQGGWQYLTGLGSRPLGEVLFSDKTVRRGKIEVTQLRPGSALYAQVLARSSTKRPPSVWGRRSLFYLPQGALMVCEFFLPDFF